MTYAKRAHYTPEETNRLLKRYDSYADRMSDAETAEKSLDEMKSILFWESIKQKSDRFKRRHYIPEHVSIEGNV